MPTRRWAIYARISVAQETSVSVDRQIESAQQYAAARGWQVVAEPFLDDGVSATHNKLEDRAGWRALLDSTEQFDSVIIWKLDRLARRLLDFHTANEALTQRGAALVAVENSIDMATADGKLIANVLASFAEYEADAISARVRAARTHLLTARRVVGGTLPYGGSRCRTRTARGWSWHTTNNGSASYGRGQHANGPAPFGWRSEARELLPVPAELAPLDAMRVLAATGLRH